MAQTIRIKRSSSATNPSNIKEGELVYIHSNDTAGKLYIGRPGSAAPNSDVAGTIDVIGGLIDSTKLSNIEANANNYSLPTATSTVLGGIELFSDDVQSTAANTVSTTANRTYGIQLNSDGQAVVNVPWDDNDTTYTAGTGMSLSAGNEFSIGQSVGTTDDVTFADITGDRVESSNGTLVTSGTTPAIVWKDTASLDKDYSLTNSNGTLTWKLHTNWNGEDSNANSDTTHEVIKINTYGMSIGAPTGGPDAGVMQNTPSLTTGFHVDTNAKFHSNVDVESTFSANHTVNLGAAAVVGTGTAENPQFPERNTTVKADLIVDGDLTVNGTTTTINTETITLADNIIELNRDVTGNAAIGSSALDGGLTVKRGTGNDSNGNPIYNASIKYHEVAGEWRANSGSSVGSVILTAANFSDEDLEIDGGTFS